VALREIRRYQKSTELLIRKLVCGEFIKQLVQRRHIKNRWPTTNRRSAVFNSNSEATLRLIKATR